MAQITCQGFFMSDENTTLTAKFYKIEKVTLSQLLEMHALFIQYYHNADLQTFVQDMAKKTGIFILENKKTKEIAGFSTWNEIDIVYKKKRSLGVFSGDTVVDKRYWGDKALQKAFVKRLFKLRMTRLDKDIYWLLISKGYKTYLLLANNFPKYYPHYKRDSSKLRSVVDHYCNEFYPQEYQHSKRLLDFGGEYQYLKGGVAEITDEMKLNNPKIKFFEDKNPSWREGTELPCVGEVSLNMMWRFVRKNMSAVSFKTKLLSYGGLK